MRFGQPDMHGHQSRLGTETEKCERECDGRPERRQRSVAHGIESELPTSALHDSEAKQDADRAEMRHQEV